MKLFDKDEGLKGIYSLSSNKEKYRKYTIIGILICSTICVFFIAMILWGEAIVPSNATPWLYLLASAWGVFSYVKVTELIGLELISDYIDKPKIREYLDERGKSEGIDKDLKFELTQFVPSLLFWFTVVFTLLLVFGG